MQTHLKRINISTVSPIFEHYSSLIPFNELNCIAYAQHIVMSCLRACMWFYVRSQARAHFSKNWNELHASLLFVVCWRWWFWIFGCLDIPMAMPCHGIPYHNNGPIKRMYLYDACSIFIHRHKIPLSNACVIGLIYSSENNKNRLCYITAIYERCGGQSEWKTKTQNKKKRTTPPRYTDE